MSREDKPGVPRRPIDSGGIARPATTQDVAALAGVSIATVSRYLNGQPIRQAAKVQRAIDELRFQRSASARSLRLGRTNSVAVVGPEVTNPFFSAALHGATSAARESGYLVMLYNLSRGEEKRTVEDLARQVDGVILTPIDESDPTAQMLIDAGVPVLLLDGVAATDKELDAVLVDNRGGARRAADYLVLNGHRRIGIIHALAGTTFATARSQGFHEALADHGITLPDDYETGGRFGRDEGYRSTLRLLGLPEPPTAIFSAGNLLTVGALRAIRDLGLSIPGDVSLIGFDDLELLDMTSPPVTVIDRPTIEQGALAMRLMLMRLMGDRGPARRIEMETRLIVRDSCARLSQ